MCILIKTSQTPVRYNRGLECLFYSHALSEQCFQAADSTPRHNLRKGGEIHEIYLKKHI